MAELPQEWTDAQVALYGKVFAFMAGNKMALLHPRCEVESAHWHTICHNAAWVAAEFMDSDDLQIVDVDSNAVVATTTPRVLH